MGFNHKNTLTCVGHTTLVERARPWGGGLAANVREVRFGGMGEVKKLVPSEPQSWG